MPETYAADRDWPVIVALHGGSGNGRDFVWTWLREAKSLEYLLLAPLCGVMHPAHEPLGNLARAAGVPIYLVHGAQDFLFPVAMARAARDVLIAAGAALEYRELPELSHTYPRSENVRILAWFEGVLES